MKIFIEFILDFWRELVFGFIILAFLFLTLGFRSRGAEISSLENEITELRSGQSTLVDQEASSTKEDLAPADTQDTDTTVVEPVDSDQFSSFDFKEGSGWVFSQGDEKVGYTFVNGSRTVDIIPSPSNLVVGADVNWLFDVKIDEETKDGTIAVTDDNENFCVAGQENCTFGDGRLQVLANQNVGEAGGAQVQLFYTDTEYVQGGDSFTALKDLMALVTVSN